MSHKIPGALELYRPALDSYMTELFQSKHHELYEMMRHQLGWEKGSLSYPGKYIRPSLMLVSVEGCGGDVDKALPGAAAIELLHNFSLIHDDIQDESFLRRGRPTVWNNWSKSQAINAGDGMYAVSRLTLLDLLDKGVAHDRVIAAARFLDETCLALCEGQYNDLLFETQLNVSLPQYDNMIKNKTASVFKCAFEMGAVIAEGAGSRSEALGVLGLELGLAYQIIDDILDIWGDSETGKQIGIDLRRGKKSLPIVYGLNNASSDQYSKLKSIYESSSENRDVNEIKKILDDMKAKEYCLMEAKNHWNRAKTLLDEIEMPKNSMESILLSGQYLLERMK
ncbi:MAG: polyprenyl synthetase family protein [Dehalococcoidia bacterium]